MQCLVELLIIVFTFCHVTTNCNVFFGGVMCEKATHRGTEVEKDTCLFIHFTNEHLKCIQYTNMKSSATNSFQKLSNYSKEFTCFLEASGIFRTY